MMSNLSARFTDLEDKIGTVDGKANSFNDKISQWDTKVDKLSASPSELSSKKRRMFLPKVLRSVNLSQMSKLT